MKRSEVFMKTRWNLDIRVSWRSQRNFVAGRDWRIYRLYNRFA